MRSGMAIVTCSVVAGAIGALLALSISGTPAIATRMLATDLGPADAVVLSGKDGSITLANHGGRVGWSDDATARGYSMGTLHVGRVMKAVLMRDSFVQERTVLQEAYEAKAKAFDERRQEILQGDLNDPARRTKTEQLRSEINQWMQSAQKEASDLSSRQFQEAYAEIREAVEVVADRRKVDLVVRYTPPAEKIRPGSDDDLARQALARTFVRVPEAIDLTDDILREMNLTAPKEE